MMPSRTSCQIPSTASRFEKRTVAWASLFVSLTLPGTPGRCSFRPEGGPDRGRRVSRKRCWLCPIVSTQPHPQRWRVSGDAAPEAARGRRPQPTLAVARLEVLAHGLVVQAQAPRDVAGAGRLAYGVDVLLNDPQHAPLAIGERLDSARALVVVRSPHLVAHGKPPLFSLPRACAA